MSTKPSVVAQTIAQTVDISALEREAIPLMSPVERLNYFTQKEANDLARKSLRLEDNEQVAIAETVKQADEERTRAAAARRVERVRLSTVLEMINCKGERVPICFTAEVQRVAAGERGKVTQLHDIDLAPVEAVLLASCLEKYQGSIDDARRMADTIAEQEIMQRVNGRSAEGLQHRRWAEAWQILIRRVVGKDIEQLLTDGIVSRIVEPSAATTEPTP